MFSLKITEPVWLKYLNSMQIYEKEIWKFLIKI